MKEKEGLSPPGGTGGASFNEEQWQAIEKEIATLLRRGKIMRGARKVFDETSEAGKKAIKVSPVKPKKKKK